MGGGGRCGPGDKPRPGADGRWGEGLALPKDHAPLPPRQHVPAPFHPPPPPGTATAVGRLSPYRNAATTATIPPIRVTAFFFSPPPPGTTPPYPLPPAACPCPCHSCLTCGSRPPHSLPWVVTGPLNRGRWLPAAHYGTGMRSLPCQVCPGPCFCTSSLHHIPLHYSIGSTQLRTAAGTTSRHHIPAPRPTTPVRTAALACPVAPHAPHALNAHRPRPNTRVCVRPSLHPSAVPSRRPLPSPPPPTRQSAVGHRGGHNAVPPLLRGQVHEAGRPIRELGGDPEGGKVVCGGGRGRGGGGGAWVTARAERPFRGWGKWGWA